jgi:uncharacterized protein
VPNADGLGQERVVALDLARGFAMLGVAVVNVHAFANGLENGNYAWEAARIWYDRSAEFFVNIVFSHRSYPVLAFLLGIGLTLQISRADGVSDARARIVRRYLALLIIGVAHGILLWPGDVLAAYALIVLTLCSGGVTWTNRRLLTLAACVLLISILLLLSYVIGVMFVGDDGRCGLGSTTAASFAQTSWRAALTMRAREYLQWGMLVQMFLPSIWAPVILGIWAARQDWFWQHLRSPSWRSAWMQWILAGFVIGVLLEAYAGPRGGWFAANCGGLPSALFQVGSDLTTFLWPPIVLTLWAEVARGMHSGPIRQRLIAVGRAPISMFIGQSICFTVIFSNAFLGLHKHLGRFGTFALAVLVYLTVAAWIDQHYIQRGRIAPGERLWRRLSGTPNTAQ